MTEIEPPLMKLLLNKIMLPEDERDPVAVEAALRDIERPLKVLDAALAERDYLLGGDFTIADLNVASVLSMSRLVAYDMSSFENVERWCDACTSRPSLARAQSR